MWQQQKKLLDNFYKKYGKFRVASHTQFGWRYYMYPSQESISVLQKDGITDRDIMKDEIVIENDLNMRQMNMGLAIRHEKKLRDNGISYTKWFSGNKSYHIHCHFKEIKIIKNTEDLKRIKRSFLLWLYNFNEDKLLNDKLDIQLIGQHLIRLEHAWHPNTMQRKTLYNEHQSDENKIPLIVWLHWTNTKKKLQQVKHISVFKRPCIMDIYNNCLDDGRQRGAFIIFNNFKREFGSEKAGELLHEWFQTQKNTSLTTSQVNYIINYHKDRPYPPPSCNYIKDYMTSIGRKQVCDSCPCNRSDKQ